MSLKNIYRHLWDGKKGYTLAFLMVNIVSKHLGQTNTNVWVEVLLLLLQHNATDIRS